MAHFGNPESNTNAGSLPGVVTPDAFGSLGPSKKWTPTQPIVLAMVLVVSAGALYAMRTIGVKHAIAFDGGKQFEFDANKDAAFEAEYSRVMGELSSVNNPLDIALVDFGRSPFALASAQQALAAGSVPIVPTSAGPSPEQKAAAELARKRAVIASEASKIVVQSVMGGRVPLARIDDEVVRIGDKIGDLFTVTQIEGRSVTIEAEGQKFVLNMQNPGEEENSPKKKRKK